MGADGGAWVHDLALYHVDVAGERGWGWIAVAELGDGGVVCECFLVVVFEPTGAFIHSSHR